MMQADVQLVAELTETDVVLRYTIENRGQLAIAVKNAYRRSLPTEESMNPCWARASSSEPSRGPWIPAGTANLYLCGATLLVIHTDKLRAVQWLPSQHPMQLALSRVLPGKARTYAIHLGRPLQEWEYGGGKHLRPAVPVSRIVLRFEAGLIHSDEPKENVRVDTCLSAGVDLAEPLLVHPTYHLPGDYGEDPPPEVSGIDPSSVVPRAEEVKREWDRRWGLFE